MRNILTIIALALFMSTAYAQTKKSVVVKKPQITVKKPQATTAREPQTTVHKTTTPARKPVARQTATAKPAAPVKKSKLDICPDNNHPHAIDLGLPSGTLWSCCNVDAELPEEFGGLYAWGEVKEKKMYSATNYKYHEGENWNSGYTNSGIFTISGTNQDVACVKWGGKWQMPSYEQLKELVGTCISEYITIDSISGMKFIGPNGNIIFLPGAGFGGGNSTERIGVGSGYYFAGTTFWANTNAGYQSYLTFCSWKCCAEPHETRRFMGESIRPVIDER